MRTVMFRTLEHPSREHQTVGQPKAFAGDPYAAARTTCSENSPSRVRLNRIYWRSSRATEKPIVFETGGKPLLLASGLKFAVDPVDPLRLGSKNGSGGSHRVSFSVHGTSKAPDRPVRRGPIGHGAQPNVGKAEVAMITAETLRRFAPRIENAELHATALEKARVASSVNTPRRLCCFMGQVFVETGGFTSMEENLRYRDPARLDAVFRAVRGIDDAKALIAQGPEAIGNRVYADRLGNGNEASGDGFRYRGSGYKQLTGRTNYATVGAIIRMDLEGNPELAREPMTAAQVAFAFWDVNGCSPLADAGDIEGITEKVNGPAKLGLPERRDATLRAMDIWHD